MDKSRKQKLPELSIENGRLIYGFFLILITLMTTLFLVSPAFSGEQKEAKSEINSEKTKEMTPWPRLFVEEDFIDFGEVPFGKPLIYAFNLKNLGVQPLLINGTPEVKTLEGC